VIKDVNGENLKVYGTVQIKINFEKETFEHSVGIFTGINIFETGRMTIVSFD
jgi:hypothetical protein